MMLFCLQNRAAAIQRTGWTDHRPRRPHTAPQYLNLRHLPQRSVPTARRLVCPASSWTTPRPATGLRSNLAHRRWRARPTPTRETSTPTRPGRRRSACLSAPPLRRSPQPAATATSPPPLPRLVVCRARRSAVVRHGRASGLWSPAATRHFRSRRPPTTTLSDQFRQSR